MRIQGYPEQSKSFTKKTDARQWAVATEAALRENRELIHSTNSPPTPLTLVKKYGFFALVIITLWFDTLRAVKNKRGRMS